MDVWEAGGRADGASAMAAKSAILTGTQSTNRGGQQNSERSRGLTIAETVPKKLLLLVTLRLILLFSQDTKGCASTRQEYIYHPGQPC